MALSQGVYFSGGSAVKNVPAKQDKRVQSLGWEGPLEKEMATDSSVFGWEIPWTEEPGPRGCKESNTPEQLSTRAGICFKPERNVTEIIQRATVNASMRSAKFTDFDSFLSLSHICFT